MKASSLQFESIADAFGAQGWHSETIPNRNVVQARFEGYHTSVHVQAQAFIELKAISIVGEAPCPMPRTHFTALFELLMHTNKQLTIGSFEFDIDRNLLVFRVSNIFDRERYDAEIIVSLVHSAIAEVDRLTPYIGVLRNTSAELLKDLSIERLLMREDLIPPVPETDQDDKDMFSPI